MEFDDFVPGSLAAYQLHFASRAIQPIHQQANQSFIGGIIHRRRADSDAQLTPQRLADLARRCARLEPYRKQHAVGLRAKISGHDHRQNEFWPGAIPAVRI